VQRGQQFVARSIYRLAMRSVRYQRFVRTKTRKHWKRRSRLLLVVTVQGIIA
jgi:hypothetical protein